MSWHCQASAVTQHQDPISEANLDNLEGKSRLDQQVTFAEPSQSVEMESNQADGQQPQAERTEGTPAATTTETASTTAQTESKPRQATENKQKSPKSAKAKVQAKHAKKHGKASKKKAKEVSSSDESESDSDSSEEDTDATSDSSSDSSSEDESETEHEKKRKLKQKKKAKQRAKDKKKAKSKRKSKSKKDVSSDSESESEEEEDADETEADEDEDEVADQDAELAYLLRLRQLQSNQGWATGPASRAGLGLNDLANASTSVAARLAKAKKLKQLSRESAASKKAKKGKKPKKKRASKLEFKRVDQLWDSTIHNYKLTDTAEDEESSEYDQYLFNVRRTFDWEGKYKTTVVDIKSKFLKEALTDVMDGVKGVSLVEDTPTIDPNILFLYLEDLRKSMNNLKVKMKGGEKVKRKVKKRNETKIKHIKVLLKYLDKDYDETKKTLYPMLESGLITFDLLWALYKPNTLAYTTTYGTVDEPRAFKIEYAEKEYSFMKGEWYSIEGRYLEYDGKTWGMGSMDCEVEAFKGARKITSLSCYPLKYHKDEASLRLQLIERGKKFVSLQGVHYKSHEGLAYYKKKRQVIKVNINGRIMVDPAIHRRILPNYQVSTVKPKNPDEIEREEDSDSDCCCSCSEQGSEDNQAGPNFENMEEERTKLKVVLDDKKKPHLVEVPVDADGQEFKKENLQELPTKEGEASTAKEGEENKKEIPVFTDEEYLIASPVVLGFAFGEKMWLEFTVSGVKDITWNEGAYESLVLEDNTKDIVKALVEAHKYNPTKSIDDVIQGKGKGLVAVLHGPPGTGKTLTAEGISEMLKCPLYCVSAGELGTDPRTLEAELQKILDIAHAWGAILLLDEADVFLEKRTIQDIHRNALVSIFLRLLEYFQGILFLTTNRVETFDDAFQSRIHIALRYGELSHKAKQRVFRMFVERVRVLEGTEISPFKDEDFNTLARHNLNGRQIKNTVRTAQALAVNKGEPLSMEHIKRVLDVLLSFDRDLKGGPGFEDAMRGYF